MINPLIDWATSNGPPNWVFVAALLTSPHMWSQYVKQAASEFYDRRISPTPIKPDNTD